ncbi:MAG: hypothetical protein Alpg2KO_21910 [Alphaproteobacteria bacterium]
MYPAPKTITRDRDPEQEAGKDNLPATLPSSRLQQIMARPVSLQRVTRGTGELAMMPIRRLAQVWRRDGTERTRMDRIKTAIKRRYTGISPLYRRDGTKIVEVYADIPKAIQTAVQDGVDLADLDAQGIVFDNHRLSGLKARRGDFRNARIECCNMSNSDLRDADFSGAHFIVYASVLGSFRNSDLRGADFTNIRAEELFKRGHLDRDQKLDFTGAKLDGAKFSMDAPFKRMKLDDVDLSGIKLVDWRGNVVEGAKLYPNGTVLVAPKPALPAPGGPNV